MNNQNKDDINWKPDFIPFRNIEKVSKSNVSKHEKLFSLDIEVFQYSCRGPKPALLKLILSPVKRLVTISIRCLESVFDAIIYSAKSWEIVIAAS